jgi:hypothetical protein
MQKIPTTKDGKIYLFRSCASDMTGYAGFKWPEAGPVEAPTEWWGEKRKPENLKLGWNPEVECGAGLHGLLWGLGDYSLTKTSDAHSRKWLIIEADAADYAEVSRAKGKVKKGNVVFCGRIGDALIKMAALRLTIDPACQPDGVQGDSAPASTTGDYAPASTTGDSAPASTTGNYAPASTTGNSAPASTTGDSAPASTTGDYAPASTTGNYAPASTTGYSAPASTTGDYAPASTTGNYAPASTLGKKSIAASLGKDGMARAGEDGCIIVRYWDDKTERPRVLVGYVGEDGIEAGVWYRVGKTRKLVRVPKEDCPV